MDLNVIDRSVGTQLAHVLAERIEDEHSVVAEAILDDRIDDARWVDAVGNLDAWNVDVDALLGHTANVARDVRVLNGLDVVDVRGQRVVELHARVELWVDLTPAHVDADVAAGDGSVDSRALKGQHRRKEHCEAHFWRC